MGVGAGGVGVGGVGVGVGGGVGVGAVTSKLAVPDTIPTLALTVKVPVRVPAINSPLLAMLPPVVVQIADG